ncbi:MAG: dTDP-4-dehydrorhamnose reductase [Candidatus Omnitrophota bacterium]
MVEKAQEKKRRKILVTGSSGMLGTDLCNELKSEYDIVGLDISGQGDFVRCDITDKDKVVKSILNAKPDLVIHAAAWTDVDGCEREPDKARKVNEGGTRNVAKAARALDAPLVYISTDFVFDGNKKSPYTEKDAPRPLNIYSKSKLEGEKTCATLGKYIIARSGWLYGSNGNNFVDTIIEKAKKESELRVVDDQWGSPTYTEDFAKAIGKLLSAQGANGIYHISNKGEVSWFDYAREILKIAGVNNVKLIPINSSQLGRPAKRPAFSVLDNTKFEKATGFIMRPWQEALKEYLCGITISKS